MPYLGRKRRRKVDVRIEVPDVTHAARLVSALTGHFHPTLQETGGRWRVNLLAAIDDRNAPPESLLYDLRRWLAATSLERLLIHVDEEPFVVGRSPPGPSRANP